MAGPAAFFLATKEMNAFANYSAFNAVTYSPLNASAIFLRSLLPPLYATALNFILLTKSFSPNNAATA